MKFGCNFQLRQHAQWKEAYINYNGIKQTVKHHPSLRSQSVRDDFEAFLLKEVGKVDCFLQRQFGHLNDWVDAILSRFSLPALYPGLDTLTQVATTELRDLGECLCEVLAFISRLEAFAKLNEDAVHRLLAKYAKFASSESAGSLDPQATLIARPWHSTAERVRDLLDLSRCAQESDEISSDTQSLLLRRVSPIALGCTSDVVHRCIKDDDPASLMVALASPVSYMENQAMLYSVLQVAINYRAAMCIRSLLEEITAPLEDMSYGHQDALHQLVIQFSRSPASLNNIGTLVEMFRELSPYQHHMLLVKDWRLRTPLHYAAEYGWARLCKQLIKFMEPSTVMQPDKTGLTPLHLATANGHVSVIKSLLTLETVSHTLSEEMAGALLHTSIQTKSADVVACLLTTGKGMNLQDSQGRTPLYVAADAGDIEMIRALLNVPDGVHIDCSEYIYGWSPLIVASVRGHLDIAELLLQAGADRNVRDHRGWTAVEHASYRAHMKIVEALNPQFSLDIPTTPSFQEASVSEPTIRQRPTLDLTGSASQQDLDHVTTVYVNLGSFDTSSSEKVLDIDSCILDTAIENGTREVFLELSATQCHEQPHVLSLPFLEDVTETTWRFTTTNFDKMRLQFKLYEYPDDTLANKRLLASGIVLMNHLKGWFRPGRQSLKRESTIALASPDGDCAGTITFTHLVCLPYKVSGPERPLQKMRQLDQTQVVGHRGLGWNMTGLGRMQLGEHTIQSLQSSLDQGADLIEFDVQITRDHVPVIYHDWQVSETGLDIPIHAMTFKQWMAISESQSNSTHDHPRGRLPWDERARPSELHRRHSRSLCAHPDHPRKAMAERMKHTVEYARNHNKGNIRGECIHDAFTTLRELFQKFPDEVHFDIELKYPMLWECPYWEMEPYWTEMNEYLDTTLDVIFELAGSRSIFFTCFNPEVCILLRTKQKVYPVVFLNDSMVSGPAGDLRAVSLQHAMRFARQWGIEGIVMAAEPFVAAPKLIQHVREEGLVCGSYGSLNDVPKFAEKQAAEGLDMLIVNNIRLISNTLRSMK
ncbi:Glycerophosphocholine phosphodiesterase [Neopestalotiopsis sp. 37M]|nr:Glycerophosphocholine phosphodiesterase [Neopestalotiopsis sp. 37M]